MLFIKFLVFVFCLSFVIFLILAFFQAKKQRQEQKKKQELFFRKIKNNYSIVKISDDVYYYKGAYLTEKYLIHNDCKIRHYQDFLFAYRLLKFI
ncbi:hypothetical protein Q7306_07725 [Glaesserella parasuis]|uniref:hypothetical protein n=1 Tax=Glaesserella parasuis TaxID=738 RepID=UPI00132153C7|nr:hypothetical protein [Glaesserella parasuis]MDG6263477.1 hypothetical protein [Glaesserella parasuis]MDG6269707.1 hypothetical protein [Glaesserella parasuis]MDG6316833.1 hypothetical protein [Glaesserella parasuis]MDG6357133.1 hypothetical protein [Glaesserella parasuis]MDG6478001.1 hypothetical protein [Glaesserella parasuis]